MKMHELKIWPEFFEPVLNGKKTFEIRIDDRGFKIGDDLLLREYQSQTYTGREIKKTITYIHPLIGYGLTAKYVCLALGEIKS